ncbi:MAG: hypothetical protein K9L98_03170 [Candidatus Pacebacteria bacterium]|nr:hypothetical protein [Candidatus Paceibacterota bacterium]MCF7862982.1 hypothetical protein [Candidatus Paceibacterota bacterium]
MKKNNIIRFVHSLVLLPILTGGMPAPSSIGDMLLVKNEIVLSQKQNIEALGLISSNQDSNIKVKTLEAQAQAIDDYFKSYDLPFHGIGKSMVESSEKYGLDWRLLPAIAMRESTGGKFACKKATFNAFGWGSCKINFDSHEEAVETVAKNLGGQNPRTAMHYAGKDTKEILLAYNPPSIIPNYVPQVMKIMEKIGEKDFGNI